MKSIVTAERRELVAKVRGFIKGTGKVSLRISEVDCVYNVGYVNDEKYVTLSTFGSAERKNSGSASQVLHIDKECAKSRVDILTKEFDL